MYTMTSVKTVKFMGSLRPPKLKKDKQLDVIENIIFEDTGTGSKRAGNLNEFRKFFKLIPCLRHLKIVSEGFPLSIFNIISMSIKQCKKIQKVIWHFNEIPLQEDNHSAIKTLFVKVLKWIPCTEIWFSNINLLPAYFASQSWKTEVEQIFLEESVAFEVSIVPASINAVKEIIFTHSGNGNMMVIKNNVFCHKGIII